MQMNPAPSEIAKAIRLTYVFLLSRLDVEDFGGSSVVSVWVGVDGDLVFATFQALAVGIHMTPSACALQVYAEGVPPALGVFLLSWVVTFTILHS